MEDPCFLLRLPLLASLSFLSLRLGQDSTSPASPLTADESDVAQREAALEERRAPP